MPVNGAAKNFLKQYKFIIENDRLGDTSFQKASEFESDIEVNEYAEGGSVFNSKDAARVAFTNLTLTRGQSADDADMENWHLEASAAGDDIGGVGDSYKANTDIVNQQRDGGEGRRYRLFSAWPKRVKVGPWDNSSIEHVFNESELAFDFGFRVPA